MEEIDEKKYERLHYKLSILTCFWFSMTLAELYGQPGYDTHYIEYAMPLASAIYFGYLIYATTRYKGLLQYSCNKVKSGFSPSLVLYLIDLALFIGCFFLPPDIKYIIQNVTYVFAWLTPIYGIITIR